MKKRILAMLLATTMICGLFTACGKGNNSVGNNQNTENDSSATAPQEKLPDDIKQIVLEYGNGLVQKEGKEYILIQIGDNKAPILMVKKNNGGYDIYLDGTLEQDAVWYMGLSTFKYTTDGLLLLENNNILTGIFDDLEGDSGCPALIYQKQGAVNGDFYFEGYMQITEDEYNDVLDSYKWVDASEIKEWYSDIELAYANRVIIK